MQITNQMVHKNRAQGGRAALLPFCHQMSLYHRYRMLEYARFCEVSDTTHTAVGRGTSRDKGHETQRHRDTETEEEWDRERKGERDRDTETQRHGRRDSETERLREAAAWRQKFGEEGRHKKWNKKMREYPFRSRILLLLLLFLF